MHVNSYVSKMFYQPFLQLRNQAAIVYYEWQGRPSLALKLFRTQNIKKARETAYSGMITFGSKKRLAKCITLLVQSSKVTKVYNPITDTIMKHRLSFITLTIPASAKHLSPREGYDLLLSHFLQWLRRTEKAVTYVWKAEAQKNGQLHYHLTTPTFIPWQRIKDKWNNLLRSNDLLIAFEKQYGHSNPNSTDIHEVRDISNISSYLVKEFCKAMQNENAMKGKLWDASENLKHSTYFKIEFRERHELILKDLRSKKITEEYCAEQFTIIRSKDQVLFDILSADEKEAFSKFISELNRKNVIDLFTAKVSEIPIFKIPSKVKEPQKPYMLDMFQ